MSDVVDQDKPSSTTVAPLVEASGLRVAYGSGDHAVEAVHGVDFAVRPGETVGIVGESGSGKSTTVMGLAGLLPANGHVTADTLRFDSVDLSHAPGRTRRRLLGEEIGVIYQDALRALNPVMKVGDQVGEGLRARGVSRKESKAQSLEMLRQVGIADAESRMRAYPHQLSGGMRQRVVIAMALIMKPRLLIADEPTTALDVTVQAQVLDLIADLGSEIGSTTLLVTHDLGVVAGSCDRVLVMYNGEIVEQGPVAQVFAAPAHPYTAALLRSVPDPGRRVGRRLPYIPGAPPKVGTTGDFCSFADRCTRAREECTTTDPPLLPVADGRASACLFADEVLADPLGRAAGELGREWGDAGSQPVVQTSSEPLVVAVDVHRVYRSGGVFAKRQPAVRAVDGVDLIVNQGETLGLVGESGCGKSTLGRVLVGLEPLDDGSVTVEGRQIKGLGHREARAFRQKAQMIFQDPRSSLNRRMSVRQMLEEPLRVKGLDALQRTARAEELLQLVGLDGGDMVRYPHEFSGGQAQRIAIARALALDPSFLVADEAVSSLDVSIQGQILNLLQDLKEQLGLTLLFISHDLGVIRQVCDRVAVMYFGKIVELGDTEQIFNHPQHPYTFALRSAIPVPDPASDWSSRRLLLAGDPPRPTAPPTGCRFHPRCPIGPTHRDDREVCRTDPLELAETLQGSRAACHFSDHVEQELNR